MPKVTNSRRSAAWATAASRSARKSSRSPIQWSAESTAMTPLGIFFSISTRARARQGAVLRPSGSTMTFSGGSSGSMRRVSSARSSVVTTMMRSGLTWPSIRCTVWWSRVSAPTMARNASRDHRP